MSEPRYLNVDLVVESRENLTPIVESFGESTEVLFNGEWGSHYRAVVEVAHSHAAANEDIALLCSLVEGLEGAARDLWVDAFSREFDIGFESGGQGECAHVIIQSSVVKRAAEAGASISFTVYPEARDDSPVS